MPIALAGCPVIAAIAFPSGSHAAELVVSEPVSAPAIVVEQGGSAKFSLDLSATGAIACTTDVSSPATATVDTSYALDSAGASTPSSPSEEFKFFADPGTQHGKNNCKTMWESPFPAPYRVAALVSADPGTPLGPYSVPVNPTIEDDTVGAAGKLNDATPSSLSVEVVPPTSPPTTTPPPPATAPPGASMTAPPGASVTFAAPGGLPPAVVAKSMNLVPRSGIVRIKPRGQKKFIDVRQAAHIPAGATVDVSAGRADITSARDERGVQQTGQFSGGQFVLGYVRDAKERSPRWVTRLSLTPPAGCKGATKNRSTGPAAKAARKKKKNGVWGDGKGNFRTQGKDGSASVRGTSWYTEQTCKGMFARVRRGAVDFRDFGLGVTVPLKAGESYRTGQGTQRSSRRSR